MPIIWICSKNEINTVLSDSVKGLTMKKKGQLMGTLAGLKGNATHSAATLTVLTAIIAQTKTQLPGGHKMSSLG